MGVGDLAEKSATRVQCDLNRKAVQFIQDAIMLDGEELLAKYGQEYIRQVLQQTIDLIKALDMAEKASVDMAMAEKKNQRLN